MPPDWRARLWLLLHNTLGRRRAASGELANTRVVQIANLLLRLLFVVLGLFVGVLDRVLRLRSKIADTGTSEVLLVFQVEQLPWHASPVSGDSAALFRAPKSVRKIQFVGNLLESIC